MGECTGCATCVSVCKAEAIYPTLDIYQINQEKCTRCGECKEVCPNDAIKTW
ncbi:MAG: 4Fe-4S binding protein [Prevotellaceae bacterium]|nr:4Fe-4S binding protein [Prevotellaceae bacterium]